MLETVCAISLLVNVIFAIWLVLTSKHAGYYQGKSDQDMNGWEDEAKFWRNVYKPEAEEKRIENGSY